MRLTEMRGMLQKPMRCVWRKDKQNTNNELDEPVKAFDTDTDSINGLEPFATPYSPEYFHIFSISPELRFYRAYATMIDIMIIL